MGDAAMGFFLQHLKQLLDYHPNIIIDVKEEIEYLYKDLSLFNAFAKEFIGNRTLEREFVKQIRDLVYRSEDAVDKHISVAVMQKSRNQFMKAIHKLNYDVILRKVKIMFDTKFEIESLQVGEGSTYNKKVGDFEGDYAEEVDKWK
ncbi:unnamed protein product [Fraxinus pennsylvanica]|uniref:Disease resistance N-terminal domain-containing protein n=1 Tax=Fraxinus pennsylvanica TaxID=56036 RepID=A0AAD2E580_9LAMI|nr:unnamed protein product [Fraxinus pennsylvanica]